MQAAALPNSESVQPRLGAPDGMMFGIAIAWPLQSLTSSTFLAPRRSSWQSGGRFDDADVASSRRAHHGRLCRTATAAVADCNGGSAGSSYTGSSCTGGAQQAVPHHGRLCRTATAAVADGIGGSTGSSYTGSVWTGGAQQAAPAELDV